MSEKPKTRTRTVSIVDQESGEVVEEMDVTNLTGRNFDQFWDGLSRKVDFERFSLRDSADGEED